MSSLFLGLVGALCWAVYDILVRAVSNRIPLMSLLLGVLVSGLIANFIISTFIFHPNYGTQNTLTLPESKPLLLSIGSGVLFLIGSIGLFRALQKGPVRLVAPIVASYPAFSILWAYLQGEMLSLFQWIAIFAVLLGTIGVAATSQEEGEHDSKPELKTALYAFLAAFTFAASLQMAHEAVLYENEIIINIWTRSAASLTLIIGLLLMRQQLWAGWRHMPIIILLGTIDVIGALSVFSAGRLENAYYAIVAASTFGLFTIIFAWLFLKEPMRPIQWLGALIAFAGIGYLAA